MKSHYFSFSAIFSFLIDRSGGNEFRLTIRYTLKGVACRALNLPAVYYVILLRKVLMR